MAMVAGSRADNALALVLSAVVVIAAAAVAVVMFAPSDRDAVIDALTDKGQEILAAARTYPERSAQFQDQIPEDAMGAAGAPTMTGPFTGLRFDRIGYFDRLSQDARTLYTEIGRFTLNVSPDGQSFTLTAYGEHDVSVHWEGRVENPAPDAEN